MSNKKCCFDITVDYDNRTAYIIENKTNIPLDKLFRNSKKRINKKNTIEIIRKWANKNNFNIIED